MRRYATRLALAAVVIIAGISLIACEDDAAFESNDYYAGFLTTQPTGKQLSNASARGAYAVAGILQSKEVIDEIARADELAEEATTHFDQGDDDLAATALDEAIEIRPRDPSYRRDRAAVALAQGEIEMAEAQWQWQDKIAETNKWTDDAWYWAESLAEAEQVLTLGISGSLASDTNYGVAATYGRASRVYSGAADFAESQGDAKLAEDYRDTADAYQSARDDARYEDDD